MCARPLTQSFLPIARSLKAYCAWREEHPVVYDAVMDRVDRWLPELKDQFERAAAKVEERAAADKQQREEQWASAKVSRRSTSVSPNFARNCPSKALCRCCEIDGMHVEWAPQLKDNFERVAAKAQVKHKPPAQGPVKKNTRAPKRKHEGT